MNSWTHDALAPLAEGFAYFGQKFRDKLAQLPEFDPPMLDEALVIANRLRSQSGSESEGDLKVENAEGWS